MSVVEALDAVGREVRARRAQERSNRDDITGIAVHICTESNISRAR